LAFNDGTFVAYNDGQVLATFKPGSPVQSYVKKLRVELRQRFPDTVFYFQPADIITQILDFGTPSQIDVQVTGKHRDDDIKVLQDLKYKIARIPGAVDTHIQQILDAPDYSVTVDRQRASELGLSIQQIADQVNIATSGSFQVSPAFWTDPKTGVPWQLWVQSPEYRLDTLGKVQDLPLSTPGGPGGAINLFSNVATFHRGVEQSVQTRINSQPTWDVYASVQDTDLGSVAGPISRIVAQESRHLHAPDKIVVRGQIESMHEAFFHIGIGLAIAVIAVYLLMVLNYQSWGDPFVVLCALPMVFSGVVFGLFVTGTSFSIPSLMGAIMSIGVASANSILLVTFAREHREETGCSALEAAVMAGKTRLRPVLMTAGAMFVGLIPMALALGEGSEANAALARAVMGGIAFGTCSTLLFVPFLYTLLRSAPVRAPEDYI
jgi:multidrug efflux pump subunit AcrB